MRFSKLGGLSINKIATYRFRGGRRRLELVFFKGRGVHYEVSNLFVKKTSQDLFVIQISYHVIKNHEINKLNC